MPRIVRSTADHEYYFQEGCYILEMLNDQSSVELSIARARVLSHQTTRWHQLRQTKERYVILEGQGLVEVGDLRRMVYPGDIVEIPPMCHQRITNTGEQDLVFLAICTPRFVPDVYVALE